MSSSHIKRGTLIAAVLQKTIWKRFLGYSFLTGMWNLELSFWKADTRG